MQNCVVSAECSHADFAPAKADEKCLQVPSLIRGGSYSDRHSYTHPIDRSVAHAERHLKMILVSALRLKANTLSHSSGTCGQHRGRASCSHPFLAWQRRLRTLTCKGRNSTPTAPHVMPSVQPRVPQRSLEIVTMVRDATAILTARHALPLGSRHTRATDAANAPDSA